jgi:hypothetical protein
MDEMNAISPYNIVIIDCRREDMEGVGELRGDIGTARKALTPFSKETAVIAANKRIIQLRDVFEDTALIYYFIKF